MKQKIKRGLILTSEFAVAIAVVGGIGYATYNSYEKSNRDHAEFMALDSVSIDAPAALSDLTLGDVFCSSVKEDGDYDIERERSVKSPIRVELADGRTVRLSCHNYQP